MRIMFLVLEIAVTTVVCVTLLLPALNGNTQPLETAKAVVRRL